MDCKWTTLVFVVIIQSCSIALLIYRYSSDHLTVIRDDNITGVGSRMADVSFTALRVHTFSLTAISPPNRTAGIRGKISGCTSADVAKKPGVVLLLSTNSGYMDMTLNLLASIKRTGICINTNIMAEEKYAYLVLCNATQGDPAITVIKSTKGDAPSKNLLVFSHAYNLMVNRRQTYLLSLLQKGFEVFLTDVDTFWFQDPFSYFHGDFDLSLVDEYSPYPQRLQKKSNYCAGLGYYKPTKNTISFVKKWVELLANPNNKKHDQRILNDLLHDDQPTRVTVRPLPVARFPHANVFWEPEWREKNNDTVIMHNVGFKVRGHDAKVAKFKENNMWLLNATSSGG